MVRSHKGVTYVDKMVKIFKATCAFHIYVCKVETDMWLIRTRDTNFYEFLVKRPPLNNMHSAKNGELGILILKCGSLCPFKK
jgi:hypothetical protein